jgi:hypothetical protein
MNMSDFEPYVDFVCQNTVSLQLSMVEDIIVNGSMELVSKASLLTKIMLTTAISVWVCKHGVGGHEHNLATFFGHIDTTLMIICLRGLNMKDVELLAKHPDMKPYVAIVMKEI